MSESYYVCEVCGERATHLVRDIARVDKPWDVYKKYEPHGEMHCFCSKHSRDYRVVDLRTPLIDLIRLFHGRESGE